MLQKLLAFKMQKFDPVHPVLLDEVVVLVPLGVPIHFTNVLDTYLKLEPPHSGHVWCL